MDKKRVLVVDNYDSFTYNLVHSLKSVSDAEIVVVRNDKFEMDYVEQFDKILLSPGPGVPSEAGLMPELIERYGSIKSILGICLGHQAISECFGATLENMSTVLHGVSSIMSVDKSDVLFNEVGSEFEAGHYHSWLVGSDNLPDCLEVTCTDKEGRIMAIRHREFDLRGVQFHPESVLTPQGDDMLKSWINS